MKQINNLYYFLCVKCGKYVDKTNKDLHELFHLIPDDDIISDEEE